MGTLYESICQATFESIRLDNQTEQQCQELAQKLARGITERLQAPSGTLSLASPAGPPGLGESPPISQCMRRLGKLTWEFGETLIVRHPDGDGLLGQAWGTFTIRRTGNHYRLSWGRDDMELLYPEPDPSIISALASSLHKDLLRLAKGGSRKGRPEIGFFPAEQEETAA